MPKELPRAFYAILFFILLAGNASLYRTLFVPQELKVTVFTAGKGAAILAQDSHNKTILINTGSDASILRALGSQLPPWRRTIDVVVLTSADTRAVGGLTDVLRRYRIKNIVRFGTPGSKSIEATIGEATIAAKNTHQSSATYGTRLSFSD